MATPLEESLSALQAYSACDVSDALLKLAVPGAGFIPDLVLLTNPSSSSDHAASLKKLIAPASTVLFSPSPSSPSPSSSFPSHPHDNDNVQSNIPNGKHWADLTPPCTVVVIRQPDGQVNAVCGGIMAHRMKALGARGVVVVGRARDVDELRGVGMPIWSRGTSTVGANLSSVPLAVQVPLHVGDVTITPGDIVFADPAAGVVVIPRAKLAAVLGLVPRLVAADDKVKEAVAGKEGLGVAEAFAKYRGNL